MAGFLPTTLENTLVDFQKKYDSLMDKVDIYQKSGFDKMASGWPSPKGQKRIRELIGGLNSCLEGLEVNLNICFTTLNRMAEQIETENESNYYNPVIFHMKGTRFKDTTTEGSSVSGINFKKIDVKDGVNQVENFLTASYKATADAMEAIAEEKLGLAFDYSDDGKKITKSVIEMFVKLQNEATKIANGFKDWETEFDADAKANDATVDESKSIADSVEFNFSSFKKEG